MHPILRKTALLPLILGVSLAQVTADAPISFDVVSIKPNPDRTIVMGGKQITGARVATIDPTRPTLTGLAGNRYSQPLATVSSLIADAYKVASHQVSGGPKWASFDGDAFEINAKVPGEGTPTGDEVRRMLQAMLSDRFQLKLHRETRPVPVYRMVVASGGLKIKDLPVSPDGTRPPGTADIGMYRVLISNFLDLPLVDGTGLAPGRAYEFNWDQSELIQEIRQGKPAPSVFSIVRDQLGLRLERSNEPMDVLVIDSVEKPSEN